MEETFFNRCFEGHSFNFLNNIDVNMLGKVFQYHVSLFPAAPGDVVFDVGTNAGSFLKVLSSCQIHSNIHCFEPHPVLSKRTKLAYESVHMNNFCLSNEDSSIDIYFPLWSVGLSSIVKRPVFDTLKGQEVKKLNVPCLTLDTYCHNNAINNIYFIKIDVEGAEKLVMEGAANMLSSKRIKGGVFEIGETLKDAGTSGEEIESLLHGYGYKVVKNLSRADWYFHL